MIVEGSHSALLAAGPAAAQIGSLYRWFAGTCAVVMGLTFIALGWALVRRREAREPTAVASHEIADDHRRRFGTAVAVAASISAVVLVALLVASAVVGHRLARIDEHDAVQVELVGHRFWWEITYEHPRPSERVVTANELHIPVGRPVLLRLTSRDVIHSLWIPGLAGKRDLIPGRQTQLLVRADHPGRYRGQCAEFCGPQHAHMVIWVVAEPEPAFDAWRAAQARPGVEPADARARRGQELFVKGPCAMCHTIAGTRAQATVGPDLTHVASRATIAAGTLPRTPHHLARWITDPQAVKPGNEMASNAFGAAELEALVAYLEALR